MIVTRPRAEHDSTVAPPPVSPHPLRARVVLPRAASSAPSARALVAAACGHLHGRVDLGDVAVVTGELVGNAVQHTAAPAGLPDTLTVAIVVTHGELRVEIGDRDPRVPARRDSAPLDEHGRGLGLVAALCDGLFTQTSAEGKRTIARWHLA
jgi:anti-sigma regulatory factor (Ser/Thr protein kinase)